MYLSIPCICSGYFAKYMLAYIKNAVVHISHEVIFTSFCFGRTTNSPSTNISCCWGSTLGSLWSNLLKTTYSLLKILSLKFWGMWTPRESPTLHKGFGLVHIFSQEALSVPGGVSNGAAMSVSAVITVDGWDSGWFVIAVDGRLISWGLQDVEACVTRRGLTFLLAAAALGLVAEAAYGDDVLRREARNILS